jgi:ABC-2 type transport system permease protein
MKAHRIVAVMVRHAYEARRNVDRVTDMIYWPVLDVVMWGFFTTYLGHGLGMQPDVIKFVLSAIIIWGLFYSFQRDLAVGFLDELWSRNLINLFSTPLTISEYMTGLICVNVAKALVGVGAASLLALAAYRFNIFPWLPGFVPYLINLILFAFALGIMITGLIFRYTTKIQALAWSFAGLLAPISCVLYPVKSLPRWLRGIAWTLPTTYSFEGMRQLLAGGGFNPRHFWCGLVLNVLYFVLAIGVFKIVFASAQNRGLLVKLE